MVKGLTGCGLCGYSLVSGLFINSLLLFLFEVILLFVYIIVEQWRRSGGLHQVGAD